MIALDDFPAITLDELTDRAELQTRRDRKYVLPLDEVRRLLAALAPDTRILQIDGARAFRYQSVYFDTPELISFRMTALRRRRRFKVRTRTYLDSGQCFLEVKTEGTHGGTVKNRLPYDRHDDVTPGRWFVDEILPDHTAVTFAPMLVTRYLRTTLYLPASRSRVTVDVDLSWHDERAHLTLPRLAVVETKTRAAASSVDRLLWAHGHRPTAISKYATGLAALRPDLPAVPWRRLMRRHFTG
jgi:hypothetical protein